MGCEKGVVLGGRSGGDAVQVGGVRRGGMWGGAGEVTERIWSHVGIGCNTRTVFLVKPRASASPGGFDSIGGLDTSTPVGC